MRHILVFGNDNALRIMTLFSIESDLMPVPMECMDWRRQAFGSPQSRNMLRVYRDIIRYAYVAGPLLLLAKAVVKQASVWRPLALTPTLP